MRLEGHCSRTGPETFNARLSLERALRIQRLLKPHFSEVASRSLAVGRGFSETILGIGTDDARDLIDRRVAFDIIDCDTLNRRKES
jgi:outer membrane protein OmpA-like peptidoglycan-associated protein